MNSLKCHMASSEEWLLRDNSINIIAHSNLAAVQKKLENTKQWVELVLLLSNSAGVYPVTASMQTRGLLWANICERQARKLSPYLFKVFSGSLHSAP